MSSGEPDPVDPPEPAPRLNRRNASFRRMFEALPENVRATALEKFRLFLRDPSAKALRHHRLKVTSAGTLRPESFSVSINMSYRAVYAVDGDTNVWYFIGTHARYDELTGLR